MDPIPSDSSSDHVSIMSRSPTPPSEFDTQSGPYHSPPSTQQSSRGTPCPDGNSSTCASSAEDDESRPAKRRRVTPTMPRDTRRLDLHELDTSPDPDQQAELDRLLKALRKNRKIVVVAGAGISVSAGIPDFRSSTGLFNSLKAQHNLKGSGKELFDAAVYRDSSSTSSFHQMVRSLSVLTKSAKPTPFHHLIARLAQEGRLLRLYSQNVDGIDTSLEPLATQVPLPAKGPWPKTIQLHGGLEKMICTKCQHLSNFNADLFEGPIPPECEQCKEADFARTEVAGKRSHGIGRLRPRMVLYNEHNPDDEAIGAVTKADLRRRPDAIIVVGTTLKIPGVKRIVREMCSIVRNHRDGLAVWINNDPEPTAKEFENCWDLIIKGTCDEVAEHAALRKWDDADIEDSIRVTDEEARLAKESGQPLVVLNTPVKQIRVKDMEALPTPAHTPRPDALLADGEGSQPEGNMANANKITLNIKQPLKPKAGPPNGPGKRGRPPKNAQGPKPGRKKQTAPEKQQVTSGNSKLSFKVKKQTNVAQQRGDAKAATGDCIKVEPQTKGAVTGGSHNLSSTTRGDPEKIRSKMRLTSSTYGGTEGSSPSQPSTFAIQTPRKTAVSMERPPVSPFTPPRPIASPITGCKKPREPLSAYPSKDNARPPPMRRFPNLVKAADFRRAGEERTLF